MYVLSQPVSTLIELFNALALEVQDLGNGYNSYVKRDNNHREIFRVTRYDCCDYYKDMWYITVNDRNFYSLEDHEVFDFLMRADINLPFSVKKLEY